MLKMTEGIKGGFLSFIVLGGMLGAQPEPLQSEDFAGMPTIPSSSDGMQVSQLSPDGRRAVYVVQDYREITEPGLTHRDLGQSAESACRGMDLWMVELPHGRVHGIPKRLTSDGDNWSPVWSPDGIRIAFVSNRDGKPRLWIKPANGGDARRVSERELGVAFPLMRWSADGRFLLYHNLAGGNPQFAPIAPAIQPSEDARVKARVLVFDGKSLPLPTRRPNPAGLIIDVETGESVERDLLWPLDMGGLGKEGKAWVIHQKYIPGSRSNLRMLEQFQAPGSRGEAGKKIEPFNFDLPVSGAKPDPRLGRTRPPLVLEPDGKTMVALSGGRLWRVSLGSPAPPQMLRDGQSEPWSKAGRLRMMRTGAGVIALGKEKLWRIRLEEPDQEARSIDLPSCKLVELSQDGTRAVTVDGNGLKFWRIADRKLELEFDAGAIPAEVEDLQISADGSTAVFIAEGPQTPRDLWTAGVGVPARNLTNLNPALTVDRMGEVRKFQYSGPGGGIRNGVVVLPVGYQKGKKYPTVILVYPSARYTADPFKFALGDDQRVANPHLLASHGFVVVAAGMGDGRSKQIPDLAALVNAAADAAIEKGWSDPERLGLYGQSDGGFTVNATLTQTTRYKAAVSVAGYANYTSRWCSLDDGGNAYGIFSSMTSWGRILGGSPMTKTENFVKHSPLFQMNKVRTPLLLVHGRMDQAVPYEQSDEVFVALRSLGQKIEYALYEGDGHSPADWSYPHQVDASKRLLRFFKTYLNP